MSTFWYTGLILAYCCLVTVIESSRAASSNNTPGFDSMRNQLGNYPMLAINQPTGPLPVGLDRAKSDVGELKETSPSISIPALVNLFGRPSGELHSSPQNKITRVGTAVTIPPKIAAADNSMPPEAKAPSLIQRMEGREADLMTWVVIAAAFFLFGWIAGGIYARRQERLRRTRLRF
jgi:hypothetical protein